MSVLTERRIKLKKYNFLFLISALFMYQLAWGQNFPFMTTAAILPLQVEKDLPDFDAKLRLIEKAFTEATQASHRFRFLNQKLVSELWSTAEGRNQLKEEFEVQVLVGLSLSFVGDVTVFTARLLSPELDSYVVESLRGLSATWLKNELSQDESEALKDLAFRLLNRLPIDLVVTSVQGRFVTLSGGLDQQLIKGQVYDVIRPQVEKRHPVNGSWLKFSQGAVGKVKVLEVTNKSAVAEVSEAFDERAIVIGDGVKVPSTLARDTFAQPLPIPQDGEASRRVISAGKGEEISELPKPKEEVKNPTPIDVPAEVQAVPQPTPSAPPPKLDSSEEPESESWSGLDSLFSLMSVFAEREFSPGIRLWDAGGSASATGTLPLWLVNHARLIGRMPWTETYDLEGFFSLDLGQTKGGLSNGFGFGSRFLSQLYDLPQVATLVGTVDLDFDSRMTRGDTYGGHDIFGFGGSLGGKGRVDLFGPTLEWRTELKMWLLGYGRAGIKGKKSSVSGSSGTSLRLSLESLPDEHNRKIGFGLELNNRNIQTKEGTVSLAEKIILLKLMEVF